MYNLTIPISPLQNALFTLPVRKPDKSVKDRITPHGLSDPQSVRGRCKIYIQSKTLAYLSSPVDTKVKAAPGWSKQLWSGSCVRSLLRHRRSSTNPK